MRRQEKKGYAMSKAVQEKGLTRIKLASSLLKEDYATGAAHGAVEDAARGMVGVLE